MVSSRAVGKRDGRRRDGSKSIRAASPFAGRGVLLRTLVSSYRRTISPGSKSASGTRRARIGPVRKTLADLFPVLIAVVLPVAGLLLALLYYNRGDRPQATRVGVGVVLGIFVYALLFL
jgi:hypothetical protein